MAGFDLETSLFDLCEAHPLAIPILVAQGFSQLDEPDKRREFGRMITLGQALKLKGLDEGAFRHLLELALKSQDGLSEAGISRSKTAGRALEVVGLLPCPVRLPLLEGFESLVEELASQGVEVDYELKAASQGLDWLSERLNGSPEELPDVFLSAGFDLFFDERRFGRFRRAGVFKDLVSWKSENPVFEGLELRDPSGFYSVIAAVPAVFLVNLAELGDLPPPRRWSDLFNPAFKRRVSLPVGDFDLFNAILVNISKQYGVAGVRSLGRSLLESLHPAQMVKSARQTGQRPIVTILPNFFTKMAREGSGMEAVWPEDGAILSPIFMLTKAKSAERLKPLVEFFSSRAVGEILSHRGLFPSLNPAVENLISPERAFLWPGWAWLDEQDLGGLIKDLLEVFEEASLEDRQ